MVWNRDAAYIAESKKIVWEVAPYLRGRGLDIGAGSFKILPHAISVDNGTDNTMFGIAFNPDVKIKDASSLDVFATQSMDYVYSSHLLEHLHDPAKALKDWWRVLKVKGVMVLYLPHEDLYPKVGDPEANPDHKHNLNESKVIEWMRESAGAWDLEVCEKRNQDDEYSFLMVFRKMDSPMGKKRFSYSHENKKPEKTACVVRYGAFGDMLMASSIWAGLKRDGYHVTVFASPPGSDVVIHDPNIDNLVLFDKDQVPNADLGSFWAWQAKKFDKFVNLSETVEGTFLAMPGRAQHGWRPAARHAVMNHNYIEFSHKVAGLPHAPVVKFYATEDEKAWAKKTRMKMGSDNLVIMWSLAGSSVHKTWPYLDNILAAVLLEYPETRVILVGGPECQMLEAGWENEPRIHKTCGKWNIRESLAMIDQVDVVIGPETGVLNAASHHDVTKLLFLSHSTHENLSRDWKNVVAFNSESTVCPGRGNNEAPACHQMHYGWSHCKRDEKTGVAQCQADISAEEVWKELSSCMRALLEQKRNAA